MEGLLSYICEHAIYAHFFIFSLLLLTGFNIPISEDILVIGGGMIASTCIPEHAIRLYIWIFMGAYLADSETYWIGRLLGPRLYNFKLFRSLITFKRLQQLRNYYAKFGIFTFIIGRFCPGGVRNALYASSGLIKMFYPHFLARDFFACLISTFAFFQAGYHFGNNLDHISYYLHVYKEVALFIICVTLVFGVLYYWMRRRSENYEMKE